VNPSDDAGGLAVSMSISSAAKRSTAANANIGNAVSFLQTQDGALKTAAKVLDRMSELKTLSLDVTKTTTDTANYQTEWAALQGQLTSIGSESFNGVSLFGSGATGATSTVSTTEAGTMTASTSTTITKAGLLGNANVAAVVTSGANISTIAGGVSVAAITSAIESVAQMRAQNGSEQSKLGFASELLTVNKANLEAANSRIVDVDVAEESTQLARWNILVQSGTAMLSQANGSAQTALRLLQ
jgi:flagellin